MSVSHLIPDKKEGVTRQAGRRVNLRLLGVSGLES